MSAFFPSPASTVNINVSGTSQAVKVSEGDTTQVRVMNNGTATAWVDFGGPSVAAALATGFPVGPGVTEVLTANAIGGAAIYAAVIAAGSTGKIYFTPGAGI